MRDESGDYVARAIRVRDDVSTWRAKRTGMREGSTRLKIVEGGWTVKVGPSVREG
jgi:hypothetical protein